MIACITRTWGPTVSEEVHVFQLPTFAGDDLRRLDAGVHVVSGTPGRVFDMIKRRALRTRDIKMLVLDEADEMLSKGFKEQIYDVYRYLPPETQVSCGIYDATSNSEVHLLRIASNHMFVKPCGRLINRSISISGFFSYCKRAGEM